VTPSPRFWREEKDGFFIRVRLTPRGGRDALEGVETLANGQSVLKARVRAAPEKGLANAALEKLIAEVLNVPKSAVSVVAGGASRVKTVNVSGDPNRLTEAIRKLSEK
jgi:uncharacterized protein YggU (UPF0235/DUF167 family)